MTTQPTTDTSLTLGVDVGGTKIAAGVVTADGTVLAEARTSTPQSDADAVVDAIIDLYGELSVDHDVTALGIGAPGFIDKARATVLITPNMPWRRMPVRHAVEDRTGLRTVVENDANAAAWGEFRFGSGADVDDLVLVTVGTGIGGGVVQDGELYRGGFGIAGEIGHLRVVPGGQECGCGNRGCWEQYASGQALERQARAAAAEAPEHAGRVVDLAGGDPAAVTGPLVTQAAQAGDPWARQQLGELGRWLGEGIASLAAVLDPAVVAVGGGVAAAGDLLLQPARAAFAEQLTGRDFRPSLQIRPATLGNRAGMIGVADLARR